MNKITRWLIWTSLCLCAAAVQAGTHHYYYTDPQGTVLAKADANGTILATYDYAPYGTAVASMSPAPNGPGYTGHVNDPDTGLVYMQARYYDPVVGRFLSGDPEEPASGNVFGFNRFAYANNDPVGKLDPDGRATEIAMMYHITDTAGYTYGHEFVTIRDTNSGQMYVTRAGPSGNYPISNAIFNEKADQSGLLSLTGQQPMTLVSSVSTYANSVEAPYENFSIPNSTVTLSKSLTQVLDSVTSISKAVNASNIPYQPQTTNSNSYANLVYTSLTGKSAPYQDRFKGPDTTLPVKSQPPPPPPPPPSAQKENS